MKDKDRHNSNNNAPKEPGKVAGDKGNGCCRSLIPWSLIAGLFVTSMFLTMPASAQEQRKPNILFMLAAEGLRMTNLNGENQCTPSRAALMTGRLPIRGGIGKAKAAGSESRLSPWEITLA